MKIILTLGEVLEKCDDWEKFCDKKKYDVYAVAEGGGDVEIVLTAEEASDFGII